MRRTFAYGVATNQGRWPVQEDGYFADPAHGVFALADGFGGRGNGDIAAKIALEEVRNEGGDRSPREGGIYTPAQAWHRELFGEVNKKILQWSDKRPPGGKGGCSLIVASVERERELTVTGCGACSAFLVRSGRWLPLLSAQAAPRVLPSDPMFPAQAVGLGRELNPESRSFLWEPGDLLFLFSSGLAWDSEPFLTDLSGQLALRVPGSDLASVVGMAVEGEGADAPWNQTAVAVESLF
ncbi:MAG TPA: hypothetical protein VIH99_01110 [Bdellovibrionota bacterium]|jgi:serine/threonine protein phosphatase PrpC